MNYDYPFCLQCTKEQYCLECYEKHYEQVKLINQRLSQAEKKNKTNK